MTKTWPLLLCLLLLSACAPRSIKIGVAVPLRGSGTNRGQEILNAVLLAAEDVNRAGGIKGRKVEVLVQDDRDLPEQGRAAAENLIKQHVLGVIGHYSSDVTLATLPQYLKAHTALISPSVSLSQVPEEGRYFFRTQPDNRAQAQAAAKFIHFSAYQRVALVHNGSVYGKDLAHELELALRPYPGIQVQEYADQAQRDFMTEILKPIPELVFYAGGYRDAALFLQRLHEAGSQAEFMGGNTLYDTEFIRLAGLVHADKVWVVSKYYSEKAPFYATYRQRFGPPGLMAAYAYDAAGLLLKAVAASEKLQPEQVALSLRHLAEYQGVTGKILLHKSSTERAGEQSILGISEQGDFTPLEGQKPLFVAAGQVAGAWAQASLPTLTHEKPKHF